MERKNDIEKEVVQETFVSIMSATVLSLIFVILSIIVIKVDEGWAVSLLSTVVYSVSIMTVMLLLLVSKRTFIIYNKTTK